MRALAVVALLLASCKKDTVDPDTSDGVVPADYGYDERPANPGCVAPAQRLVEDAQIDVERVFQGVQLNSPVGMFQAPGDPEHWFVIEQAGRVKQFDTSTLEVEIVLDITGPVVAGGELGLLGMAFHPDFESNGLAFLSYTGTGEISHVSRVQTSQGGAVWDAGSLEELISAPQPYSNHNGGHIEFGPDGMLYWGLGDGGAAGDPENRAQDLTDPHGKVHRIDVDTAPYAVPPDNPFVGHPTALQTIYAYGIRNPWRFSIDPPTGDIWLGDVGQNAIEEVSLIEPGGNYGWRIKEGRSCYAVDPCDGLGLIDPVVQYQQNPGFSVVGGVVYRGEAIPALQGTYLFSDYYHGRIIGVTYDPDTGAPRRDRLVDTGHSIVHFATGLDGEIYYLDHQTGRIYTIVPLGDDPAPDFPRTLSASGCVDPAEPTRVASGVVPYDLVHPFWSDGAEKKRWLAIPDGTTMEALPDGDIGFPVGTVLVKEFTINDTRVETRLFMQHQDGWAGYTYKWRADGSDADLVAGSEAVDANGESWTLPSRPECMQCHSEAANRSLGLELGQLTGTAVYPETGREAPQLATLDHVGMLTGLPDAVEPFPAIDDEAASLEDRARTYLHVNCSSCHRPEGPGRGDLDLRLATPLAETHLCDEPQNGDLDVEGARVVRPGDPSASLLSLRMNDRGAYAMPPIASAEVDPAGVALIDAWITSLTSCP